MAIQSVVNVNSAQAVAPSNNPSGDVAAEVRVIASAGASPAAEAPRESAKSESAASAEQVRAAADKINKALQNLTSSNLEFSVDDDTGQTIVRVVDIETKDVIRQIPNEETLKIAKSLGNLQGLLIQQKA